jgi:hypothetical protein
MNTARPFGLICGYMEMRFLIFIVFLFRKISAFSRYPIPAALISRMRLMSVDTRYEERVYRRDYRDPVPDMY